MKTILNPAQCETLLPQWRAVQKASEFSALLRRAVELPARNVMEIGIWYGGTLRAWQALLPANGFIIALDVNLKEVDKSTEAPKEQLPETHYIEFDSKSPAAVARTKELLADRMLDVLWIDGDHDYEGVKSDYDLYSPFVRSGGLIAFHDIAECPSQPWVGVRRFWLEIKDTMPSQEAIGEPKGWGGIGILTKP